MLSGAYFPIHPKPRPDELLSSWIIRTALGHGQTPYVFGQTVWPGRQLWNRDIDNFAPRAVVDLMAARTGTPRHQAEATTLAAHEGELVEHHFPWGRTKWVLRAGVFHRTRRGFGLQFCPGCLSEGVAYFRREWRLAWSTCCPEHGTLLLDRCPDCLAPIVPHRADPMTSCFFCGTNFRQVGSAPAQWPAAHFQRKARAILERGYALWGDWAFQRPFLFFDLVHQVLRVLASGPRASLLREFTARYWDGDPTQPVFAGSVPEIEALDVHSRHRLVHLASHLLEGWPWRFVAACAEVGLWWSWAMRDLSDARYAYEEPIRRVLRRPSYAPSEIELEAARSYLIKRGLPPSSRNLRSLIGDTQLIQRKGRRTHVRINIRPSSTGEGHEAVLP